MNKNIQKVLVVIVLSLFGMSALQAQVTFADFRVKTEDDKGNAMSGVKVVMLLNSIEVANDTTDTDGRIGFPTLSPGTYTLQATKEGFPEKELTNLTLIAGLNAEQVIIMAAKSTGEIIISANAKKSPINLVGTENVKTNKDLLTSGQRGIGALVSSNSAIVQTSQGISIRGTRADGNATYVDGVRAIGSTGVGTLGTESVSANIGGIPAQYGDLTGGAFSYTTKSASERLSSAIEAISSSGLDAFSHNTLEGFLSGPLWVKKYKDGTAPVHPGAALQRPVHTRPHRPAPIR